MNNWDECFAESNLPLGTSTDVLEKIERLIERLKETPSIHLRPSIICTPDVFFKIKSHMRKVTYFKYRGMWRAHKQQGITNLSRSEWLKGKLW